MLVNGDAIARLRTEVDRDDFALREHRLIWDAALTIVDAGGTPEPRTVAHHLEQAGYIHDAGGRAVIFSLIEEAPPVTTGIAYAGIVREKARVRRFIAEIDVARERIFGTDGADIDDQVKDLSDALAAIPKRNRSWKDRFKRLELPKLHGKPKPERKHVIDKWGPVGSVIVLTGHGGGGKSTILQSAATCVEVGKLFLGLAVERKPSAVFFGEESLEDIHIRQHDISEYYGIPFSEQDSLHLVSLKGEDCTLFSIANDKSGTVSKTPLFNHIRELALDLNVGLLGLDHWGLMVRGSEGDRHATGTAINLLGGIAEAAQGIVVILQHPSKSPDATYSGNTGFEGGVRALWNLKNGADPGARVLRLSKAN